MRLVKAHAYGNDFLICEVTEVSAPADRPTLARRACDRHRGVGADGVMFVTKTPKGADTELWNADGSPSEVSGNGIRCVGAWLAESGGLKPRAEIILGTGAGARHLHLLDAAGPRYTFRAAMGAPTELRQERLSVAGETIKAVVMRVGNPQCVVLGAVTHERL